MSVTFGMILIFVVGLLLGREIERFAAKEQASKSFKSFIEAAMKQQQKTEQNKGDK